MSVPETTKCIIINRKPVEEVTAETFKLETKTLQKVEGSKLLLKVLYLSNDPAQRTWIQKGADPERAYAPIPNEGDIMPARGICEVVSVGPDVKSFKVGDRVLASSGWSQYTVQEEQACNKALEIPGQSPSIALGALGMTGLTAYWGLLDIAKATSEDQCIVVSGAAGATGNIAIQLAKKVLNVKNVIGIAGGKEKCDFVKSIGADHCIDYKSSTWKEELRELTQRKIDVYFDNVGGEILDEVFPNMKRHGRIAQCGMISSYHSMDSGVTFKNYFEVISNRLSILGFIVIDALPKAKEYVGKLAQWVMEGKIKIVDGKSETVKEATIEQLPETWQLLFSGGNSGKLVTKLSI